MDAIKVQSASSALGALTKTVVDDLIAKKDIIKAAGQQKTTADQLAAQKIAAEALAKMISSKLPASIQKIAEQLSKGIADDLDRGAKAFA